MNGPPSTSAVDPAPLDVFISAASEDYPQAREVYEHLTQAGLRCFFSNQSLDETGQAEYKRVIDGALEQCRHLVVVTSSHAHAEKQWVRYEWDSFAMERLAGRKAGNLFTLTSGQIRVGDLPLALRNNQVFAWPADRARVLQYVGRKSVAQHPPPLQQPAKPAPERSDEKRSEQHVPNSVEALAQPPGRPLMEESLGALAPAVQLPQGASRQHAAEMPGTEEIIEARSNPRSTSPPLEANMAQETVQEPPPIPNEIPKSQPPHNHQEGAKFDAIKKIVSLALLPSDEKNVLLSIIGELFEALCMHDPIANSIDNTIIALYLTRLLSFVGIVAIPVINFSKIGAFEVVFWVLIVTLFSISIRFFKRAIVKGCKDVLEIQSGQIAAKTKLRLETLRSKYEKKSLLSW